MHNLLHQIRKNMCYKNAQGPIWFLQLWPQLYFKDLSVANFLIDPSLANARVLGTHLMATPIEALGRLGVLRMLCNL